MPPSNGQHSFTDNMFAEDSDRFVEGRPWLPRIGELISDETLLGSTYVSRPAWETAVLSELQRLAHLRTGWDSYGAPPIRWDACFFALLILQSSMRGDTPLPQVVPSSVGGVQLEWHEQGLDIELHITAPYECELWYQDQRNGMQPVSEDISNDFSSIQRLIAELTLRGAQAAHVVQH